MAQNSDEVQQKINSLLEFHKNKLEEMEQDVQNPHLGKITKQLLEQAIEDKKELIKNLQK